MSFSVSARGRMATRAADNGTTCCDGRTVICREKIGFVYGKRTVTVIAGVSLRKQLLAGVGILDGNGAHGAPFCCFQNFLA
jgi:hypothetical protein